MTHFGPQKSARLPCENANVPHCAYFTRVPPLPDNKALQKEFPVSQGWLSHFWTDFASLKLEEEKLGT